MGFKIIREDEPLEVNSIVAVIYGEPGIGKTSLAFTADHPVLEDYDGGLKRAIGRKTALEFDSWDDSVAFHNSKEFEEIAPRTLIFDTAGTMLDNYIAQYVMKKDFKNSRSGGELSLQGYGAMKSVFRQFMADMKARKIDIIFIAHQETQKEGDTFRFVPKMTGGSSDILLAEADMVGNMNSKSNKRSIDFNPTDQHIGKNTAEFESIEIPHYQDEKYLTFMADLIAETKRKMMEMSKQQQEAMKKLAFYRKEIQDAKNVSEMEELYPAIESMSPSYQVQLLSLFDAKYKEFWDMEMRSTVTDAKSADLFLKSISEAIGRYVPGFKKLLWLKAKEMHLSFDEATGLFVDPVKPDTAKPDPAKPDTDKANKSQKVEQPSMFPDGKTIN